MAESIVKSSTEAVLNVAKIGKIRVLHVDDEQGFLKVAKQCLEMQGEFEVDTASSVNEAMEKMKKETYDAVVSDYQMPEKDGLQFLKELRQKGNNIPFVIFTGKGREEIVIKALNLGADHYENKKGDPETVYSELSHDIINIVRTRRAEQELRIQREELQVILDSMPAKIWYKDRNNRLVRVNKAFAEYMGASKENLEGKSLGDLFPPDIAQKCWEEDNEVITTGQPKTDILDRHESAQGVRWFSTGKVPCREKDGSIIGTINVSIDITERKKAEVARRKSEEKFRNLFDKANDAMVYLDGSGRILDVNIRTVEMFGGTKEELIGKQFTEVGLFSVKETSELIRNLANILAGNTTNLNLTIKNKKGQQMDLECSVSLMKSDESTSVVVVVRDISERKKAEETLRNSEERWRSLAEGSPDHIMLLDLKGNILYINRTVPDLKREEVIGTSQFNYVPPEGHQAAKDCFRRVIETGKTDSYHTEYRTKDDEVRYFDVRVGPVFQEDRVVALISSSTDVTSQKKAGEKLRESEQKFRCLVEEAAVYVGIIDLKGQLAYVNKALADSLGYSVQELEGRPFKDFLHPDDRGKIVRLFLKSILVRRKPQSLEFRVIRKDDHVLHWMATPTAFIIEGRTVGFQAIITDITERKTMEEEIRSLARFPSENPNSVLRMSREGVVLYANNPGKALLQDWEREVVDHTPEFLRNIVAETISKQSEKSFDLKLGKQVYSVTVTPVMGSNYANIYAMDKTERRKAEEQLKESENKYRELFETSIDAIATSDMNGHFIDCNQSCQKMLGYTLDEMRKLTYQKLTPEKWQKKEAEIIEKEVMKKGYTAEYEKELIRKDGTIIPVSNRVWGIFDDDGKPKTMWGIVRDITERKLVERTLRESEEKLRSIVENSSDQIFMLDRDGKFLSINKTAADLSGMSPQEMIGRPISEIFPETIAAKFSRNIKNVFDTGKSMFIDEKMVVKGRELYNSTSLNPVKDIGGRVTAVTGIVRDITERKKAEQTLRASLERYRSFIEVTGELGWTTNSEGAVVEDTPSFRKFTGQTYEEVKGWGWIKALHPDDVERATEIWKKATRTKSKYETEYRLRRHDGIFRYFMAHGVPVLEEDGSIREWVGTCIDITERKAIEDELRSSQERLKILFESAPDAYYLNDLKGNFIDGNKAAQEITGYDRNELVGKSFLKLKLLPRSQIWKAAKLLALNAAGKPTGPDEFVMTRKDGTQVPVEIRTFPVRIEGRTVVLGIARDISIRRKNEQTILENQQKFEGLFRHNPEAAVYLDLDSKVLDVNPRFCELFGYSVREVEGKQINELVAPEDKIEEAETLDKDAKKGYTSYDTVRKRKDGSLVHVSISAAPVTVEGRLLGYVGVYKDITKLKNAEEHLKKMNEKLEITNEKLHVVGGLTRHDVRNKLSAVTGNAYLLKRKLTEDPKALEQLSDMEAAVRLVERIFEFARVYERLGVEQLASMDVGKAVNEAASLFSDLKGVKIVNECRGMTVLADSLLSQLFYNLIDNSLKHGEKIRQIKIHYKMPSANQLELIYEDDGVGISDKMRSNLFKEGFTSGKGTGYGLFMIKRICEVYGWTIQETGKQGKGAQFTMSIPRMHAKARD